MEPDPRAAVDRAEMLDVHGFVRGIKVQRDDPGALTIALLIPGCGHIQIAVVAHGEMSDGAEAFGDDRRVEPGGQPKPIGLIGAQDEAACDDHGKKSSHLPYRGHRSSSHV